MSCTIYCTIIGGLILYIRGVGGIRSLKVPQVTQFRSPGGHIQLRCNLREIEWLDPYFSTIASEERPSGSLVSRMKQEAETYTKVCVCFRRNAKYAVSVSSPISIPVYHAIHKIDTCNYPST